jgi:hypothetical protein
MNINVVLVRKITYLAIIAASELVRICRYRSLRSESDQKDMRDNAKALARGVGEDLVELDK